MPKTLKETEETPKTHSKNDEKNPSMSLYEQSREERIKENLQRMQKLGIFDLSKKLNSAVSPKSTPKHSRANSQRSTPVLTPGPLRRSSRLQNATLISEAVLSKKYKGLEDNTDGRQIHDPVNGKTCHQCRKKTLGHHTQCSECKRVRGQFCGNCLYTRYGEHVLEALENPNWICPVCRGICNCCFCRKAKGLFPTGTLYKKISRLGFKSVAHYLFQTERAQTTLEKRPESDVVNLASAKRLQNATPVSYSEAVLSKKYKGLEDKNVKLEEGKKPEVYTKEHEKLLVITRGNGKSCHQCRQKTLGDRTQCSECNRIQGQFCEDCLYTRYGEHVLEALENPNWICPVCRGICNCSLCRKANGLCPTGALYKKISKLGFKSVAHYLFQTERASAKRSLSFSDSEALLKNSPMVNGNLPRIKPQFDDRKDGKDLIIETESKNVDSTEVDLKVQNHFGLSKPQLEEETDNGCSKGEEEKKLHRSGNDSIITLESCSKSQKKRAATSEPSLDSIASRLRQRRSKGNGCDGIQLPLVSEKSLDV